jgi:hypothetical protein
LYFKRWSLTALPEREKIKYRHRFETREA